MKKIITILMGLICSLNLVLAQNLSGVKICVNPGHGGFDSDDRNVVIAPYTSGNQNGFWESQSNLDKGKQLKTMLEAAGATVIMTRMTNTTADDLNLSVIVAMANQGNADFMLSIHSNAGNGGANSVLQLYAGKDASDTYTYATATPWSDKSRQISTVIAQNQYANQITTWSSGYSVTGDKTFGRTAMGWSDGYGVLRGLTVPGTISEGAMHDYIPETYRLMNMEYKWLEAWNFFKSFVNYFKPNEVIPTGNIAGSVRDVRLKNEATYTKLAGKDQMLPLNGATLTLIETGATYTVDQMQNGVYVFKNLTPGIYHVKAEATGYYSSTQEITVTAGQMSYFNFSLNRIRNTPPQVVSYTPQVSLTDSVECSTSIVMNFNWDMDETSTRQAFSISPAVDGVITFEDTQYRMRFTPNKPLDKNTIYTVTLAKSASHPDNLSMTQDFSFQFKTKSRNRLALVSTYPYAGAKGVYTKPVFRLIFDRVLYTTNLQSAIKVYDKNNTEVSKSLRTIINNKVAAPAGSHYFELANTLNANEDYKLVIPGNVMDEVGVQVVEPIEINFHTSPVAVSSQPIAETFETLNYAYDASQSSQVTSASVSLGSSKKLFDTYAGLFAYSFAQPDASVLFKANTANVSVVKDKVVGLHIYGDLSGNELQLQLTNGTDIRYVKLCDLKFFGWEFVEAKLSDLAVGSSYQLTGFKVIRKLGVLSSTGELSFDNLLLYDNVLLGVSNILKSTVKIYPNPTSDMIRVSGDKMNIPELQLFTLDGVALKKCKSTEMSVSDLPVGTYLLKITVDGQSATYPVIISR